MKEEFLPPSQLTLLDVSLKETPAGLNLNVFQANYESDF